MNSEYSNGNSVSGDRSESFEETLRLISHAAAPDGLEERIQAGLRNAPRKGRVIAWPANSESGWRRAAAAAAIVFVVAGGGWGIYSRVQPAPLRGIAVPPHMAAPGGFSSAGAMRTPQTLNQPVLTHPEAADLRAVPLEPKTEVKAQRVAPVPASKANAKPTANVPAPPALPAEK